MFLGIFIFNTIIASSTSLECDGQPNGRKGLFMLQKSNPTIKIMLLFMAVTLLLIPSTSTAESTRLLTVQSINDVHGEHSADQALSVLGSEDLTASQDDWDNYIEFAPANNSNYTGVFTFQLPADISPADVTSLVVETNYMGPDRDSQRWQWRIRDVEKKRFVLLGDNSEARDWYWTSMSWTINSNACIDAEGRIKIKFRSNNAYDVCNIDYLVVRVQLSDATPDENLAPVVDAGKDQILQLADGDLLLDGSVSDEGLPTGGSLTTSWSMASGADSVSFDDPSQAQTRVHFSASGTYELTLSATDGELSATDTVQVTVEDSDTPSDGEFKEIPLKSEITSVQPMTGIVLWTDSDVGKTDAIQLEYAYMKYNAVVQKRDQYDWDAVDNLLTQVAARGHQAILRFYFVYPGDQTTVPKYIKDSSDYNETKGSSEGLTTWFPDWSSTELKSFTLDFYEAFAQRYDGDPRLAFLQVGFGLWAEYHIYDGPLTLGRTFPSKAYQAQFIRNMDTVFDVLPWSISIDAMDGARTPFEADQDLLEIDFGLFDDSFLHETHSEYNAECFNFFEYQARVNTAPMGGELSYYSDYDQKHALDANGPYGTSFEKLAAQYNITYMIGNDQPDYQSLARIQSAGMATGYKFQVKAFQASATQAKITVKNTGIAPIYFDAYVAVNGKRSSASLKGLMPGTSEEFQVESGGEQPTLAIECDRLVTGQEIEFDAQLP